MKVLIGYGTKYGTTEKCVQILQEHFLEVHVCNLDKEIPEISLYDVILVGGSIYMGKIQKSVKQFLENNQEILLQKKAAYFICCAFEEEIEQQFIENFPKKLLDSAITFQGFGGEMELDRLKPVDKLISRMVIKSWEDKNIKPPQIKYHKIEYVVNKVLEVSEGIN